MTSCVSRRDELFENLATVQERVRAACLAARRSPDDVSIIAVTKTWPVQDIHILAGLGVVDIGESKDQEASQKYQECSDLGLRWHFIGQFQTNKAASIARYADVVHSIDRLKAAQALSAAAAKVGRHISALVQVSLDEPSVAGRGGAAPEQVLEIAEAIASASHLTLGGVMAVAPLDVDPALAFQRLHSFALVVQQHYPEATIISAGMSDDMDEAVANGATHLRIGSSIMGSRSYVQ